MDAARKGIITSEMEQAAASDALSPQELMEQVAAGTAVIPANKNHKSLKPTAIGKGLTTKINVNLGISKDCCNFDNEIEKVRTAVAMKADAIMDLSCFG